jgi:ABC-type sugar transport system ATPase subunit
LTKATYAVATSDRQRRDRPLAIDAQKVERRFGGSLALKGVSVQARQGTIHALVGENGAGKSTFLGIIAGRISPTSGRI